MVFTRVMVITLVIALVKTLVNLCFGVNHVMVLIRVMVLTPCYCVHACYGVKLTLLTRVMVLS